MQPQLEQIGAATLGLAGDLTFSTVADLYTGDGPKFPENGEVTIDLNGASRIDSAGVALLVHWARQAREHQCRLRYQALPQQLDALLRVYGMARVLELTH